MALLEKNIIHIRGLEDHYRDDGDSILDNEGSVEPTEPFTLEQFYELVTQRLKGLELKRTASDKPYEEVLKEGNEELQNFLSELSHLKIKKLQEAKTSLFGLENTFLNPEAFELLLFNLGLKNKIVDNNNAANTLSLLLFAGVRPTEDEWYLLSRKNDAILKQIQETRVSSQIPELINVSTVKTNINTLPLPELTKRLDRLKFALWRKFRDVKDFVRQNTISSDIQEESSFLAKKALTFFERNKSGEFTLADILMTDKEAFLKEAAKLIIDTQLFIAFSLPNEENKVIFPNTLVQNNFWKAISREMRDLLTPLFELKIKPTLAKEIIPFSKDNLAAVILLTTLINGETGSDIYTLDYQYLLEYKNRVKRKHYLYQLQTWIYLLEQQGIKLPFTGVHASVLIEDLLPRIDPLWQELINASTPKIETVSVEKRPLGESYLFTNEVLERYKKIVLSNKEKSGVVPWVVWVPWKYAEMSSHSTSPQLQLPLPGYWLVQLEQDELIEKINEAARKGMAEYQSTYPTEPAGPIFAYEAIRKCLYQIAKKPDIT